MKGTKAASRYAKALLDLAIDNNQVDLVLDDMKYLAAVANESRDFQMLIQSPIVSSEKKISIFGQLFGHFQETTSKFIELIAKKGREVLLGEIAASYEEQVNQYKGIKPVTIVSAVALDEATKNKIVAKIQGTVSGTLQVTEKIDPSIIGGFIVRMDDKQIDASVANQLDNLKQRLTR